VIRSSRLLVAAVQLATSCDMEWKIGNFVVERILDKPKQVPRYLLFVVHIYSYEQKHEEDKEELYFLFCQKLISCKRWSPFKSDFLLNL
jgi:hypothetical protein